MNILATVFCQASVFCRNIFLLSLVALPVNAGETTPLPDPTKPFGASVSLPTANKTPLHNPPVLQAIIKYGDKRKAMINGNWVVEQQAVLGGRVSKISDKSVWLLVAGRTQQLDLQPSIIQPPTATHER